MNQFIFFGKGEHIRKCPPKKEEKKEGNKGHSLQKYYKAIIIVVSIIKIETIDSNQSNGTDFRNLDINPFTVSTCKVSGQKEARTCLQTVYFPVL